jgi:hypothetical protein
VFKKSFQNIDRHTLKYCTIVVGVGGLVECATSFITWVRLVSPIGGALGGSRNLSTSLSNVARLGAHPKFVWVFNDNYDSTMTLYNLTRKETILCTRITYFIFSNIIVFAK